MNQLISPKLLSQVLGVSESTVRRLVDAGQLASEKTTGGHRRIRLADALAYARGSGLPLRRWQLLGLEAPPAHNLQPVIYQRLRHGDRARLWALVAGLFASGWSVARIGDEALAPAMHRLGQRWCEHPDGILEEHQATEMVSWCLGRLRDLLPPPSPQAPLALGGALQDDPYRLAPLMASTVLVECGLREVLFGPHTPATLLCQWAVSKHANLVWVSLSVPPPSPQRRRELLDQIDLLRRRHIPFIAGGRHGRDWVRGINIPLAQTMAELAAFARGLATSAAAPSIKP